MAVLSNKTKGKAGLKAVGAAVKYPAVTRLVFKGSAPAAKGGFRMGGAMAKRQARRRVEDLRRAARIMGEMTSVYGPEAAQLMGWVEPPKPKRTAPRVMMGIVIGATAMYFLEPGAGKEHRQKALSLIS